MQSFQLQDFRSVLCLGAHADDIEIGCGASLLDWFERHPNLHVTWVVWSAAGERRAEARKSAEAYLEPLLREHRAKILIENFRDAYFPADWADIKQRMAQLATECQPDLVLTHRLEDRHQDHRVLAELTWNAFRDQVVLEYEIPKFEGDLGQPNLYVPVSTTSGQRKVELLHEFFITQTSKDWFTDSTFHALMRLRGLECRAPSGLAEAFYARKLVWTP